MATERKQKKSKEKNLFKRCRPEQQKKIVFISKSLRGKKFAPDEAANRESIAKIKCKHRIMNCKHRRDFSSDRLEANFVAISFRNHFNSVANLNPFESRFFAKFRPRLTFARVFSARQFRLIETKDRKMERDEISTAEIELSEVSMNRD